MQQHNAKQNPLPSGMGSIKFPALPKVSAKGVTRAIFHEMAPDLLKGFVKEIVSKASPLDTYKHLMEKDLWDMLPEKRKPYLLGLKPWDLSWFSVDWIFQVFKECNPKLAMLLATSPQFHERMKGQVSKIKVILT